MNVTDNNKALPAKNVPNVRQTNLVNCGAAILGSVLSSVFCCLYTYLSRMQLIGLDDASLPPLANAMFKYRYGFILIPTISICFLVLALRWRWSYIAIEIVRSLVVAVAVASTFICILLWEATRVPTFHGMRWHLPLQPELDHSNMFQNQE